jgi:hypothetical protein
MSQEYNELVCSHLSGTCTDLYTLLEAQGVSGLRGVAAMLIESGAILRGMRQNYKETPDDLYAVKQCLDLLSTQPGAIPMLLGQLSKALALIDMGYKQKEN